MHSSSKRTTSGDLSKILEALLEADIQFILVGGLASVVQGAPITTMDVDIIIRPSSENIGKLMSFLKETDAIYRRPNGKTIAPIAEDFSGTGHILLSTRLGSLDVLGSIEEKKTFEDLLDHSVEISFRGHTLRALDLKHLIRLKKESKDINDRQRLAVLEETLRQLKEKG